MRTPTNAERHSLYLAYLGYLQLNPDTDPGTLSQWGRNHSQYADQPWSASTHLAVATRAVRAQQTAATTAQEPGYVPSAGEIPSGVGLQPSGQRFEYVVLVQAEGRGGVREAVQLYVTTDVPISAQEAYRLAELMIPRAGTESLRRLRELLAGDQTAAPSYDLLGIAKRGN